MSSSWLIIADDLTGAADCAIAFAQNGFPASVLFGDNEPACRVSAIDAASRPYPAEQAARIHAALLERRYTKGTLLYKKVDSLMRGQPVAEIVETIKTLRKTGGPAFAVLAPAFPATGRTTVNGCVFLNGEPLETTAVWARDHSYPTGDVAKNLRAAGLDIRTIALDTVRLGARDIARQVQSAMDEGCDGVVCDAEVLEDLDRIAEATYPMAEKVFWVGTGGLAVPLARLSGEGCSAQALPLPDVRHGILMVVGSLVKVSRDALRHVLQTEALRHFSFAPEYLFTATDAELEERGREIAAVLVAGGDVAVEITEAADPDLAKGGLLAGRLARALREALQVAGGLVVTGGETATKLMAEAGITGIRLAAEVESGVPAGLTLGACSLPIITKAGSFGSEHTLGNCLLFLREAKGKGNLP